MEDNNINQENISLQMDKDNINNIQKLIADNAGDTIVELLYTNIILKTPYKISQNHNIISQLESLCIVDKIYRG